MKLEIVISVILLVLLFWVIYCCCRRAYQNEKQFKQLINSPTVRDNIRFIMGRFHGSQRAITKIEIKYHLSEIMALRLIHRIDKEPL